VVTRAVTVAAPAVATFGPHLAGWRATSAESVVAIALGAALLWCCVRGMITLFREREVTADGVATALCAYLLIGLAWTLFYVAVHDLNPDAFRLPEGIVQPGRAASAFLYFSFVTLATLGYGDITPHSEAARALAVIEAIVGQFFVAVVLARLVALEIATATSRADSRRD
jgi:uncharacterized membrane protein